ncbi:hypothetical protein D3C87_1279310 [compost metagenome]
MSFSEKLKHATGLTLVLAAAGATAGLLVVCVMAGTYAWARSGIGTEGMAAWVQAVGSILAVLIAVMISARDRKIVRDDRHREQIERRIAVSYDLAAVALELQLRIAKLGAMALDDGRKGEHATEVIVMKDLLRRLGNLGSGDSPETLKNLVFEIRQLLAEVLAYAIGRSLTGSPPPTVDWLTWQERSNNLFKQATMFR